uniref:Integrin subunit alpha M n=1 Tax=Cavia porcellus TaxID=10141 RepID=A0A286X9B0_CAVPO
MTCRALLVTALALCHGFNLDTENPITFQENARGFGQTVVQLEGSRMVVGAPQEIRTANQTGGLYQCDYSTSRCEPVPLQVPAEAVNMSLGLSLSAATKPTQLLACGPTVHQICKENIYVNGLCFLFGSNLRQQPQRVPQSLRGCPHQESDIAFLIDGSGSININDFQTMKEFVSTVMEQFQKSKTLFSLMQYSNQFRTHFTFNGFKENPDPRFLVNQIRQLTGQTYTATGIRKVIGENAIKILVVITDGEKYGDPLSYEDVIPEANRRGVIRYVIGVGDAFTSNTNRQELNTIASAPARDHVFQVNNFEALKTIQNQLQEKIFAIEGTQTGSTSSFEHEMSQEGFSAALTSKGPLLGSVGSFDWAGGAFLYMSNGKATFINKTRVNSDMNDAYLGYAAAVIMKNWGQNLVLGAPRYQHTGLVVMFKENFGAWESSANIQGSQRITGSQLSPRLQYFGQSLSGGQDLTMDGLMDLSVGAQGYALLLRSQPLLRVEATMTFKPKGSGKGWIAGKVTVCLRVSKNVRADISYVLSLDSGRSSIRAVFDKTKNNTYREKQNLGLTQKCETLTLLLLKCVDDSVTPIALRLNYTLVGTPMFSFGNLRPVLAEDAQKFFTASFPFEKNCGNDSICQDDLSISFNVSNLHTLVVGDSQEFNVLLTVRNQGEDSYGTKAALYFPAGLSYRKASAIQSQHSWRSWSVYCLSDSSTERLGTLRSISCSINHPIFPDNSEVTSIITFDVDFKASLGNKLLLKANVTSENNMPRTKKTEFQLELPVKYAVYLIVTSGEASTTYLNFTTSEKTIQTMKHQYKFTNLGKRSLPISVVFWVPVRLNNEIVWDRPQVTFSPNLSSACNTEERSPPHSDFLAELEKTHVLNCSIAVCQRIACDIPYFNIQEEFNVTLHGNLSFNWYIQTSSNHILVVSTAEILFNDSVFALLPGQGMFVRSQTETKVELYEVHNPLPLIVGSSIGGLVLLALITVGLYKLGFFKRQYKDMMTEAGPQEPPPQ